MVRSARLVPVLALFLLALQAAAWGQSTTLRQQYLIYAGPLHRDYLGCLNCDQFDTNSVWDAFAPTGWTNAFIEASHFATYRAKHGRYSSCDPFAADPPILIDISRHPYGVLNVSETRSDSVCGPHGTRSICQALKEACANGEVPQP